MTIYLFLRIMRFRKTDFTEFINLFLGINLEMIIGLVTARVFSRLDIHFIIILHSQVFSNLQVSKQS